MHKDNPALRAIDEAIDALSLEMWRGTDPRHMERVYTPEASIALELDRVDRAIGPAGQSMFGILAQQITQAMIALHEARQHLNGGENGQTQA